MNVTVRCADCGRVFGTQVFLGKKQDREIEIHACHHRRLYGNKKEKTGQKTAKEKKEVKSHKDTTGKG